MGRANTTTLSPWWNSTKPGSSLCKEDALHVLTCQDLSRSGWLARKTLDKFQSLTRAQQSSLYTWVTGSSGVSQATWLGPHRLQASETILPGWESHEVKGLKCTWVWCLRNSAPGWHDAPDKMYTHLQLSEADNSARLGQDLSHHPLRCQHRVNSWSFCSCSWVPVRMMDVTVTTALSPLYANSYPWQQRWGSLVRAEDLEPPNPNDEGSSHAS